MIGRMTNTTSQGVYAPLPQSQSDSDSEKDNETPHIQHYQPQRQMQNGHNIRNGFTVPNTMINVPTTKTGFRAMSLARKIAFIISIVVCFLVVIVFLFLLPCSNHNICPLKISSWKNEHEGVEFKGDINVVHGFYSNSIYLALLTKKCLISQNTQSGAIALKSSNGGASWFVAQVKMPLKMNCAIIDANKDNILDCLLLSDTGLEAINARTGDVIWHVHTPATVIGNIDFPKLLPDFTSDGINELITVTSFNGLHNKVVLINGFNGKLLLDIVMKNCTEITDFKFEDNFFIYSCINGKYQSHYFKLTLYDLQNRYNNSSIIIKPVAIEYHPITNEEYISNNRRLVIENSGVCPNCHTNIALIDDVTQKRIYGWSHDNTYSMHPISFAFKTSHENLESLRGHVSGFIVKLWQWQDRSIKINSTIQRNSISEKVVLITFNDTNVHVINVSYAEITQLCFPNQECQPDLSLRNDSMLISDLDLDNSQELISYSSTYKCSDETDNNHCVLVSSMEVIQLEAELPKLYAK